MRYPSLIACGFLGAAYPVAGCSSDSAGATGPSTHPLDSGAEAPDSASSDAVSEPETIADDAAMEAESTVGVCESASDVAILQGEETENTAFICGYHNFGQSGATTDCIAYETKLSTPCSQCYGVLIQCGITNCWSECEDVGTTACEDCLDQEQCTSGFEQCKAGGES